MSTKKANLILTTCSMAWGTSYIFMKLGIEGLSPLMLMALRTGIAFLILVLIFFKRLLKVNKRLLLYSAITGFLLFNTIPLQICYQLAGCVFISGACLP